MVMIQENVKLFIFLHSHNEMLSPISFLHNQNDILSPIFLSAQ